MLSAQGQTPITTEQGMAVAKELGAIYRECSAKTNTGVTEVFETALQQSFKSQWKKKVSSGCVVL